MKISNDWLKQYVPHTLSPAELADLLTMSGLEVDDLEPIGGTMEGVVVGHVLETRKHPNADRLTLCTVDLGDGEPVQIVCGAPNVAAGQKVPVATVGTTLMLPAREDPSERVPFTLKKAKLRGEASHGMICAEDELGLSGNHDGIMVLRAEAAAGQPFRTYLEEEGLAPEDAVLDVAITPNRPDATSHFGVARDVAALTDLQLARPSVTVPEAGGAAAEQVAVEIQDPDGCGRYVALLVRGVKMGPSPAWLQQRLRAVGLRPRNNIVDITNFVMYEIGQPLHAFDADEIAGAKIIVRQAAAGEPFTTLDSKTHELPEGTVLICDAERPVAIGGVMGGENSEVTDATTNVLIESAYFDPSTIRKAAKALGLQTDASYRFERGVDPAGQAWAAARAAELMVELAGGKLVPGMVDAHPRPHTPRRVALRLPRVAHLLGIDIPEETITNLLKAIGFGIEKQEPLDTLAERLMEGRSLSAADTPEVPTLDCIVPSFRPDVERDVDVIEEIARLYGYDRIPEPSHTRIPNVPPHDLPADTLRRFTRRLLLGLGYREVYTNSMLRKETAARFNDPALQGGEAAGDVVETLNPISQEMAALRPTLLPGVLSVAAFNHNHGQRLLRFYEFGHIFHRTEEAETLVPGYDERETLLLFLSGADNTPGWDTQPRPSDFFDLKGIAETLLDALHIDGLTATPQPASTPVTAYHLALHAGGAYLGLVARLADDMAAAFDLQAPVFFAEFDWAQLVERAAPTLTRPYTPVSRYPTVQRDLAVVVARDLAAGDLLDTVRTAAGPLLRNVDVFDLYEGEKVGAQEKSIAFALRFGADRTLQDAEVEERIAAILDALQQTHRATLRQ